MIASARASRCSVRALALSGEALSCSRCRFRPLAGIGRAGIGRHVIRSAPACRCALQDRAVIILRSAVQTAAESNRSQGFDFDAIAQL